jgi:hypothetical protein
VARIEWRDEKSSWWKIRYTRLAWQRRINPGFAFDLLPGGLGQDPISFIIALPGMIVLAVLTPLWLVELLLRLLIAPVTAVLRGSGRMTYRVELLHQGKVVATHHPRGREELHRVVESLRPPRP